MVKHKLLADEQLTLIKREVGVGDWVVHLLSGVETAEAYGSVHKYTTPWSAPAKVVEVQDKICHVAEWHTQKIRQVPLTLIRKLQGAAPVTLQPTNEANLQRLMPRRRMLPEYAAPEPWEKWLSKKRAAKEDFTAAAEKAVKQPCLAVREAVGPGPE